jgi:autotransporter adhesin
MAQNVDTLAIGSSAQANGVGGISLGSKAKVGGAAEDSVALGARANATQSSAVALGADSTTDRAKTVSVGNAGVAGQRQVVNMAAGTSSTDAVNVSQLSGLAAALGGEAGIDGTNGSIIKPSYTIGGKTYHDVGAALMAAASGGSEDAVQYDSTKRDRVTLGGATPGGRVTLANVAAGVDDYDAVNVKQLTDMGGSFDSSGHATNSFVAYDDSTKASIKLQGTNNTKISGLADGTLSTTSNDAINGKQLYQTNQNVTNLTEVVNNITNGNGDGIKYFHVNSTLDDSSATGSDAVAIGGNAKATAKNSVALGSGSVADRENAVSVGSATSKRQLVNVAAGVDDYDAVNVKQLTDMGGSFDSSGHSTNSFVAYDDSTKASIKLKGTNNTKISGLADGTLSTTSNDAINGKQLYQTNQNVANVAGNVTNLTEVVNNITNGNGDGIKYFHANSTLDDSSATGTDAVAIGGNAKATANNAVALGANSTTTANLNAPAYLLSTATLAGTVPVGEVSVGSDGKERRLTNVAAGSAATDAVNVSQLKAAVVTSATTAMADAVQYDSTRHNQITLGGATPALPVLLTNLALGKIETSSRDAVNGSQLYDVSVSMAAALGGSATVKDGAITSPTYNVSGGTFHDVGAALSAIDGTVGGIDNTIFNTTKYIKVVSASNAAIGGGAYANKLNSLAIGAGARALNIGSMALGTNSVTSADNTISVGYEDGERRIMNVADGVLKTDVATVGQLNKLQEQLAPKSNGVKSMLQGVGASVTDFIAVSPKTTPGA